jgi:hypothetical protein
MNRWKRQATERAAILWEIHERGEVLTANVIAKALGVRPKDVSNVYQTFARNDVEAPPWYRTARHQAQAVMDSRPRQTVLTEYPKMLHLFNPRPWYDEVLGECKIWMVK